MRYINLHFTYLLTYSAADHATYSNKNETKNDKIAMKVSKQAKKLL